MVAVVDERERIARDLHDGLGANLTAALWQARRHAEVPTVAEIEQRLLACLDDLGALVWATRRDDRRLSALWTLLRARCDDLFGAEVRLEYDGPDPGDTGDDPPLDGEAAVAVLFIVFEAVRNAVRHARPAAVRIRASAAGDTLTVDVRDDGGGFDPEAITPGHGLRHMAERAASAGGSFALRSRPGETLVSARVPMRAQAEPSTVRTSSSS
jgi:signal transduction histidine kinase